MVTAEVLAPESQLEVIPKFAPADLFKPGFINPVLDLLKAEFRALPVDMSTDKGRKEIASRSFKIGKAKNLIDEKRKLLVADEKLRLKAIDAEGARIWDDLEAFQKEIRKPLTDWEEAEKARVQAHEDSLTALISMGTSCETFSDAQLESNLSHVTDLDPEMYEEFCPKFAAARDKAMTAISAAIANRKQMAADKAELERLRAEAAERARIDREADIARQAAAKAEAQAGLRADEEARRVEAQRQQAEFEKAEAVRRAEEAEAARVEAEAKVQRDIEAALEAERKRLADKAEAERKEAEARERNRAHRSKINRAVRDALVPLGASAEMAESIVKAIAAGQVPHTTISY